MKRLRPIEVETCCICGEQFDKMDARRSAWKHSSKGKQVIEESNKR